MLSGRPTNEPESIEHIIGFVLSVVEHDFHCVMLCLIRESLEGTLGLQRKSNHHRKPFIQWW